MYTILWFFHPPKLHTSAIVAAILSTVITLTTPTY